MLTFRAEVHLNISAVPPSWASFAEISSPPPRPPEHRPLPLPSGSATPAYPLDSLSNTIS